MKAPTAALLIALALPAAALAKEAPTRMTPKDIAALAQTGPGAGSSGVAGIKTTVLAGDPEKPGLYTIRLSVPAHTDIQAHSHRDDRMATVVSGTWYFAYGDHVDPKAFKTLPPGSFYTEPAGAAHFARTGDQPVTVYITGFGPTDTTYVKASDDPRHH